MWRWSERLERWLIIVEWRLKSKGIEVDVELFASKEGVEFIMAWVGFC